MPEQTPQHESPYELQRLLENVARFGTVAAVRHSAPARCRVQTGENTTDWLPWTTGRAAGKDGSEWWPPEVGEQCLVLAPGGDMAQAVVVLGVYSDHKAQPSSKPATRRVQYSPKDYAETTESTHTQHMERETLFEVSSTCSLLMKPDSITAKVGDACSIHMGTDSVTIKAGGAELVIGPDKITANVNIETSADVMAGPISLLKHLHLGVTPGMGLTKEPVPG